MKKFLKKKKAISEPPIEDVNQAKDSKGTESDVDKRNEIENREPLKSENKDQGKSTSKLLMDRVLETIREHTKETSDNEIHGFSFISKLFKRKSRYSLVLTTFLRLFGGTFIFVIFEIAFFSVLLVLGTDFIEVWMLETCAITYYAIFAISTLCSSKFAVIKFLKVFTSIIMFFLITGFLLIIFLFFESLITLKIIMSVLDGYYVLNIVLFLKSHRIVRSKIILKSLVLISLTIFSNVGIPIITSTLPNKINIQPKSQPEIVFLCGSNQLPEDPNILDLCKKYNVGFMPTIREFEIGNENYMRTYKKILARQINLYFLIGGATNFYAYVDNAHEFIPIYGNISQWFVSKGIMDNPHVTSFFIDAETPQAILDQFQEENAWNALELGYNQYPTQIEVENATNALMEFARLIKNDGKKCGMIRAPRYLDPADGDGDLSLFVRNIYSFDIEWDFTITMMYRTNNLKIDDESVHSPPFYSEAILTLFYGAAIEGTTFTTSELSFYQNVELEQNQGHAPADAQYIFLGNFEEKFKNTRYIKEKEYLVDFDICRHFNKDKVFFYDLQGFLYQYGWKGIEELGQHNLHRDNRYLIYDNNQSLAFLTLYCIMVIVDAFFFLEKDLAQ